MTVERDPETTGDRQTLGTPARRTVLKAAAAAGLLAGTGSPVVAQDDNETDDEDGDDGEEEDVETYVFGGKVEYWFGVAPEDIEGEENPTLELEEDQDYEFVWINMDGEPHEMAVQDEDEEDLESAGEEVEEVGEIQTLEFTASSDMDTYYCTVHPETQIGDLEISSGDGDGNDD